MGGCGSGRHKGAKKRRVESCLALDANELRRQGVLVAGAFGTLTWARDGEADVSVAFRADAAGLILSHHGNLADASRAVEQHVVLSSIPAALGGSRLYFICPGAECGRRVSVLYFARGLFLCRHRHGLGYASQCEDATRRARRRANKQRARLGGPNWNAFARSLAARPKGMWRTTFNRLLRSAEAADAVANVAYLVRLAKLIGKVDRRRQRTVPLATPTLPRLCSLNGHGA